MYVQCEGVCVEPKHFDRGDMVQKRWSTGINQAGIIKHEVYNEENASSKKKSSGDGYRYNVLPCESMIRKYLQIISG